MNTIITTLLFLLLCSPFSGAMGNNQTQIDSLKAAIRLSPPDSTKANQYLALAQVLHQDLSTSFQYADSSLQLSNSINYAKGTIRSLIYLGNNKRSQGDHPAALNFLLEALKHSEEVNDSYLNSKIYNSLATIYYFQSPETFGKAIEYNLKAIEIQKQTNDLSGLALSYANLGSIYGDPISTLTFDQEKALQYFKEALEIARQTNDKRVEAGMLGTIGFIYMEREMLTVALSYMNQSYALFRELGNRWGEMTSLYRLGVLYRTNKDYKKSIESLKKTTEMATELGYKDLANNAFEALSRTYYDMGNYKEALESYYKSVEIKFEMYNNERIDKLAEYEKRFETVQKEKEIEILKRESELFEERIKKQQIISLSIVGGVIFLLLIVVLLIRSNNLKQKANRVLTIKNAEISQQKEEIESQKDEIETQRDMVVKQRDMLESVHKQLTDSIHYAQSIQAAILPSEKVLQNISNEYFILMKPCELVSGDFFWATSFDDYHIFCVADCTGHGVPGAFMSILGITALNEIIGHHHVTQADQILNYLRQSVIDALSQNDPQHLHKDGMDMALCVLNKNTRELQFAGAGQSLWLVSSKSVDGFESFGHHSPIVNKEYHLYEVKGDTMPVGQSPRIEPFKNRIVSLKNVDVSIYLATDGFADQLGFGNKGKFGITNFKKLIIENADKNFNYQREVLDKSFDDWKGENYQVDDVTVLGIKV
jgi:serine phosphatase RsbU (regulator of sigma subunit)